ncbi:MAG: hypothetical protein ABW278_08520 [Steroidobacteraceae bacterium]
MRIIDILIILACLATGYWIVNSVIGADKKEGGKDAGKPAPGAAPQPGVSLPPALPAPAQPAPRRLGTAAADDWHLVLDVPRDASPRDIQAAMKRRLAQAEADRDAAGAERIRNAAAHALRQRQTP